MSGVSETSKVDLMTPGEVADALRVSKMTVYRMIHGGSLPAIKIGERSFRVKREYVNELLRDESDIAVDIAIGDS